MNRISPRNPLRNRDAAHGGRCSRALILFAKRPLAGAVKTRLLPLLTAEAAAELYACLLRDTLAMVRTLSGISCCIFYQDDPGAAAFFAAAAPDCEALPQRGADLGARMQAAFGELFGRGFGQVAIIGSDAPGLPADYVAAAFARLDDAGTDVVFGPAIDGGYYLLAMKRLCAELFAEIPWSSGEVLARSRQRAAAGGLGVALLPSWHDLDTPEDLERLLGENTLGGETGDYLRKTRR